MTRPWVRFLGASQLLGGILVVSAYAVAAVAWPRAIAPWQNGLAVAFGAFVGFAGVELLRASPRAIGLSIVAQAVQVVAVTHVPL